MRRTALLTIALLASPITLIAAGTAGPAAASASASTTAPQVFPTVSGSLTQTPKMTFPTGKAPTKLEVKVLHKGTGAVTKTGEVLTVNYVGQIWGGKVFDSSFSRKELFAFSVGEGQVISGWDKSLVGVHAGSRVLVVVPPADGYGSAGQSSAGITGKDDIVFVVHVENAYNGSAEASTHATQVKSSVTGITVTGKLGAPPKVKIAKGTAKPKSVSTTILDRGTGSPLKAGAVVVQYVAVGWTGTVAQSTWASGQPYGLNLVAGTTFPDTLIGIPVGSRVLIKLPSSSSGGPYAMVLDVVAQPKYQV